MSLDEIRHQVDKLHALGYEHLNISLIGIIHQGIVLYDFDTGYHIKIPNG